MMRAAWLMLCKDLRLFVRDRVALLLAVALPLVLVTVFGAVMANIGGGSSGMPAVELTVFDADGSAASAELLAALAAVDGLELEHAPAGSTREALRDAVHDGDATFVLIIPAGYAEGKDLELLRDPGDTLGQQLLSIGLLRALFATQGPDLAWDVQRRVLASAGIPESWMARVDGFTLPFRAAMEAMFADAEAAGLLDDGEAAAAGDGAEDGARDAEAEPDGLAGGAGEGARPDTAAGAAADGGAADIDFQQLMTAMLPLTTEDVLPEGRDAQITYQVSHAVSGMTVMMLMFSLMGYARGLLEERDAGTLRRLLVAPIDPRAVLFSKFLGAALLGLVLTAMLFVYAALLFDLDVASRWDTLLVVSAATAASVTGFVLLIAVLAKSDKQADGLSTLLILVMSSVGGAWVPLILMPPVVRQIARFTLPYWSIDAYQGSFWYGQHWTDAPMLRNLGVMLALAVTLTAAAAIVFRRRYLNP